MTQEPQPGGIVISGGNVRIGAMAQGTGAHAEHTVTRPAAGEPATAPGELAGLMRGLIDALRQHESELADGASAQEAADQAAAEAGKDTPDISRVRRLLKKVASAAGPVSEIAAAIITIERAITGMP